MIRKRFYFFLYPGILKLLCKIVGKTEELERLTGTFLLIVARSGICLGGSHRLRGRGIKETVKGIC